MFLCPGAENQRQWFHRESTAIINGNLLFTQGQDDTDYYISKCCKFQYHVQSIPRFMGYSLSLEHSTMLEQQHKLGALQLRLVGHCHFMHPSSSQINYFGFH